ncbi:hypothetical protein KFJ24_14675 [Marinobacter sediminum]|uniref:hypothetical protein n=1 Tax=Marinobacter sediminum TaxID=256323 RepID=UPI00202EBAAC|nr:hypothetical protein [Marinobacter sediminum]MCM0613727.1 hypothetical protein [Marinobacter sediminum]
MTWSSGQPQPINRSYETYSNACTALNQIETQDQNRFLELEQLGFFGTGARVGRHVIFPHSGARIIQSNESNEPAKETKAESSVGITDVIADLKLSLGLPTKDIAAILQVSRQTLYAYQKSAEAQNTMNKSTKERSMEVYALIKSVNQILPKSPGPLAKNVLGPNGKSLFDLLSSSTLDGRAIENMARELADRMTKSEAKNSHLYSQTLNELTSST